MPDHPDGPTGGDSPPADALVGQVYGELHRLAHQLLAHEQRAELLQTTALVNEAYLRLAGKHGSDWVNRAHFFAAAALAMRRILVDQARRRHSAKHGGQRKQVSLDGAAVVAPEPAEDILALDEALARLEQQNPRQGQIVMLRYFAGLNVHETAEVLSVSAATVKADWSWAKAWLHREIAGGNKAGGK